MDIIFDINPERLSVNDLIVLDEYKDEDTGGIRKMRDILARFVDEVDGVKIEDNKESFATAQDAIGSMSLPEMQETMTKLSKSLQDLQVEKK